VANEIFGSDKTNLPGAGKIDPPPTPKMIDSVITANVLSGMGWPRFIFS
jgi:hypothetical protein